MLRGARCAVGRLSTRKKFLRPVGSKRPIGFAALLCKESRAAPAPEKKFSLTRAQNFLSEVDKRTAQGRKLNILTFGRKSGFFLHGTKKCRIFVSLKLNVKPTPKLKQAMKKNSITELLAKMIVAALTAALTALTTTSCMGYGPLTF